MAEFEFRVATEFNVVRIIVPPEIQQRVDRLLSEHKCLGCERELLPDEKIRRGLCSTCYTGIRHAIARHGATQKKLMEDGYLLPKSPGGRPPRNAFTAALFGRKFEPSESKEPS